MRGMEDAEKDHGRWKTQDVTWGSGQRRRGIVIKEAMTLKGLQSQGIRKYHCYMIKHFAAVHFHFYHTFTGWKSDTVYYKCADC